MERSAWGRWRDVGYDFLQVVVGTLEGGLRRIERSGKEIA